MAMELIKREFEFYLRDVLTSYTVLEYGSAQEFGVVFAYKKLKEVKSKIDFKTKELVAKNPGISPVEIELAVAPIRAYLTKYIIS